MPEPPDLQSLARRFLDLWQENLAASAEDPELAAAFGRWLAAAGGMAAGFGAAARGTDGEGGFGGAKADRTASARGARGGGGRDLDELARRLAALEKRLARLESGARGKGGGARSRTRASRAKGPRRRA